MKRRLRTGVVVALAAEARALTERDIAFEKIVELDSGVHAFVCGMAAGAATRAAEALAESGVQRLVSFGMAGALDPALRAGDLLLPSTVIDERGRRFATAPLASASAPFPSHGEGGLFVLLTTERPLLSPSEKSEARARTGAGAVDMESAMVAEVALSHALPFVAMRAVIDRADDVVPAAAMMTDTFGRPRSLRLAATLLRHPGQLPELIRLSGAYARALATLRGAAAALG